MRYTTLIDTRSLADLLETDPPVLVDCRFSLADPDAGAQAYREAHIPGAVYAHLDHDLSAPRTGTNGRHPLPVPAALTLTLGRLGITPGRQVVAYDQDTGMFASRLWWLLRWMGHDAVAVLDGGMAAWIADGRPHAQGTETAVPRRFTGTPVPGMTVSAAEVDRIRLDRETRLVDARAPERFRGDVEPIDPVAGHIAGAVNHPFSGNLRDGRFLSAQALRERWAETLDGRDGAQVVAYCGSGVTACHNLLALEHAGIRGARLYGGSWSEWIADPTHAVAQGDA